MSSLQNFDKELALFWKGRNHQYYERKVVPISAGYQVQNVLEEWRDSTNRRTKIWSQEDFWAALMSKVQTFNQRYGGSTKAGVDEHEETFWSTSQFMQLSRAYTCMHACYIYIHSGTCVDRYRI